MIEANDPIVIWGSGAIGGTIGAYLARAGRNVIFVDADPAHVAAISEKGLSIAGPMGDFTVRAKAVTPDGLVGTFQCVALAVKGHHTASAAAMLAPHLARDGFVLSLQNGLNDRAIADVVGTDRVVLSLVNFASDVLEPGVIHYGGRGTVVVGEPNGTTSERVADVVTLLQAFDPAVEASDNVAGFLWGKLGYGGILIGTALTNDTMADLLSDPTARPILGRIAQEVMAVAAASGVQPVGVDGFDAAAFAANDADRMASAFDSMAEHYRHSAKSRSGVWRDLAVRKRPTEVGAILGPVAAIGAQKGVATPVLDRLVSSIREIEEGRRTLDRSNLAALVA